MRFLFGKCQHCLFAQLPEMSFVTKGREGHFYIQGFYIEIFRVPSRHGIEHVRFDASLILRHGHPHRRIRQR